MGTYTKVTGKLHVLCALTCCKVSEITAAEQSSHRVKNWVSSTYHCTKTFVGTEREYVVSLLPLMWSMKTNSGNNLRHIYLYRAADNWKHIVVAPPPFTI
eukprot:5484699-Amphidinium_carterae.1